MECGWIWADFFTFVEFCLSVFAQKIALVNSIISNSTPLMMYLCITLKKQYYISMLFSLLVFAAKPFFIVRLPPYRGFLMNSKNVALTCRVECSPLCSISWRKDGLPLRNITHYRVISSVKNPDPSSGWGILLYIHYTEYIFERKKINYYTETHIFIFSLIYFRDLESVQSVLEWRMDQWPNRELDRERDNSNFTCVSSSNSAGSGVSSSAYFRVECE